MEHRNNQSNEQGNLEESTIEQFRNYLSEVKHSQPMILTTTLSWWDN